MKETHRGIPTITNKKNERKAKTIINRLGQKSMSLPRIDDKKRFAGFMGLAGISRKTAKLVPSDCKVFVECFAGSGKITQELMKLTNKIEKFVLNDKSAFVYEWLKREMPNAIVTQEDFVDCILKWDGPDTVFLIDDPWFMSFYKQSFTTFDRPSVKAYNEEIIAYCELFMQGRFIITSRKENRVYLKSKFYHKLVKSEYVVCGKYPKVLLTTNIDFRKKQ